MLRTTWSVRSLVVLFALCAPALQARELTFEGRVEAQAAIERVYHAHQIGTPRPFAEAMPRAVLEAKVEKYLKQSVALERFWHTPVTAEALQAEMERQSRQSRMPERLRALYVALGDDPFLVRECLARPALVDRLARNFFAFDERFHTAERAEAEELRRGLLRYGVDAFASDPRRSVSDLVQAKGHARPGEVGSLREEREAFVIEVVLEEPPAFARIARFTVAKRSWDSWWEDTAWTLDAGLVAGTEGDGPLPVVGSTSCLPDDTWANGSLDPQARSGHTAIWTGSLMIVWGGSTAASRVNTGSRYDPVTDTWTPTSTVGAPAPRDAHTVVWTGSLMIVWGGVDATGFAYLNTGGRYDPATDSWAPTSMVSAPSARQGHTAVWTGSRMIVWGGDTNTGGRYDPGTDSWTPTSTIGAAAARRSHTAVWTGSRMVVWGGFGGGYLNTGGRYDPVADSWTSTSIADAPQARELHTVVWTGNLMIVWGGEGSGGVLNVGGRYDPVTNSWTSTSTAGAPSGRNRHTVVWTGSLMVVWAGFDGSAVVNTGGRYDPVTDSWTPTSIAGAPSVRWNHSAVWTGAWMIVWGGGELVSGKQLDTGGRYDPTTNSWTPTDLPSGPDSRIYSSAVWTGSLMVVWGGGTASCCTYLDTGGRYDPSIDSWTTTSTVGAPSGRQDHTALWAGNSMLVWGGKNWGGAGDVPLGTGGRYDPMTDSWTSLSTVGAPPARYDHTAVWSGNRMVVWGGIGSGSSYLGSGGRYDPAGNTWTPLSSAAAPSARASHTAVWTGSRMIVWGGSDGSALGTGRRYDPVSDTWSPVSVSGNPAPRYDHTAVWTGNSMVVWGGRAGSPLDTGGRYDPATNSWTSTSTTDAPSARTGHTAVWTGSRMIVWGGQNGPSFLNTGGRYDPSTDGWLPTSSLLAPTARYGHAAVWTGNLMIVWGGYNDGELLNSGGRYSLGQSTDDDGDGLSDCDGDCNDTDAGVVAIPTEVNGLQFAANVTLEWDSAAPGAGSATVHDVLTGLVTQLPVGSGGEACLGSTAASSIVVADVPLSGSGYWYLVRGRNLCGTGTYGNASNGSPRNSDVCP